MKKTCCIWCEKRLVGYDPQSDVKFGPRQRTREEHIIPDCIWGRVITRDMCVHCNSWFGKTCDHAMLNDQRINDAAQQAGYKYNDLHEKFEGKRKTASGREVRELYRDGEFKSLPELSPKKDLMVPVNDWSRLREQTKGSLIAKVLRKNLSLSRDQVRDEVEKLLQSVDAAPTEKHSNETIHESFQLAEATGPVSTVYTMNPWETDWCLAKIVFELSSLVWPDEYQVYCRNVIGVFRDFIEKQEHDPETKSGTGMFSFAQLDGTPQKRHEISGIVTPDKVEWQLTFFGTARWEWNCGLNPIKSPAGKGYRITIDNPFGSPDCPDACVACVPFT